MAKPSREEIAQVVAQMPGALFHAAAPCTIEPFAEEIKAPTGGQQQARLRLRHA